MVCQAAKLPLSSAPQWIHETYGFALAVFTFAIVFGAFSANVLFGAMRAVPHAQQETAYAYGMTSSQVFWRITVPQMWVYALPGLGNLWMVLIKATPLLFLLGIEDIVYWARELGGSKTARFTDYPHPDWRIERSLSFSPGERRCSVILFSGENQVAQAPPPGARSATGGTNRPTLLPNPRRQLRNPKEGSGASVPGARGPVRSAAY